MKLVKTFITLVFIVLVGGFIALGFMDMPVQQQDVVKDIPHEALFQND